MSANNQLVIKKINTKCWVVYHNLCVDEPFNPSNSTIVHTDNTIDGACMWAQDYCDTYPYVEYGYTVLPDD